MKSIRCILFAMVLSGCIVDEPSYRITHPDVMYVGDSLCHRVFDVDDGIPHIYENDDRWRTAERMAGIRINCDPGRKTTDIDSIPESKDGMPWRVLFLSLGTNDAQKLPVDEFRHHYQALIDGAEFETLYCVLPNRVIKGHDSEPYRQAIREMCANVIDPLEHGVKFRAKDGVHKNKADQPGWWVAIVERIES